MKRQAGFTLMELAVAIAILSITSIGVIKWTQGMARDAQGQVFKSRIETVISAVDSYYIDQVTVNSVDPLDPSAFPSTIDDLMTMGFLPDCTPANAALGYCINYSVLPVSNVVGGQPISISTGVVGVAPVAFIEFPMDTVTDPMVRVSAISALSAIPGFTIDSNDLVSVQVRRPGQLAQFDSQLNRDGTQEMLADWNTGPHNVGVGGDLSSANLATGNVDAAGWLNVGSDLTVVGDTTLEGDLNLTGALELNGDIDLNDNTIYNVKHLLGVEDVAFKHFTDRTLVSGLRSSGSKEIASSSGAYVPMPSCPPGYTPRIEVSIKQIGLNYVLIEPSNTLVRADVSGTQWNINMWISVRTSYTSATRAWVNQGILNYETWCDH